MVMDPATMQVASMVAKPFMNKLMGGLFGGGPKMVTNRSYKEGRKLYEGYDSPSDTEGSFSGWNWGDYGIGKDFSDERKEFIDKILRENPGVTYLSRGDKFTVPEDQYYRPGYEKVTGEDSMDDREGQAYQRMAQRRTTDLNKLYSEFREGTLEASPEGGNGDGGDGEYEGPTDDEVKETILDYGIDDPGLLSHQVNYPTIDPALLQSDPSFANTRIDPINQRPYQTYDFNRLGQPIQLPGRESLSAPSVRNMAIRNILGGFRR